MNNYRCSVEFYRLTVGTSFVMNGTRWQKASTRTAKCLDYKTSNKYFSRDEKCVISREQANELINRESAK